MTYPANTDFTGLATGPVAHAESELAMGLRAFEAICTENEFSRPQLERLIEVLSDAGADIGVQFKRLCARRDALANTPLPLEDAS